MRHLAVILLAMPFAASVCPQGAVQGTRPDNCYLYGSAQSWQEAEAYCASNKGHLSSVQNAFVNAFLISYPNTFISAQSYWLGAELKSATEKWAWTDGSDFTYTKWAAGEPKQGPGCAYVDASTGQWHSGDCDASKPFVCKVPPSCKPAPKKCEDGWTFNEKLNKCYKTLSGVFNWDSAFAACRGQGAHLPSIHDDAENIAFAEIARDYPLVILGLRDNTISPWAKWEEDRKVFHYEWTDGSFVNYVKLQFDEYATEYHPCVHFQTGQDGVWITADCLAPTKMATAVCVKSPKEE